MKEYSGSCLCSWITYKAQGNPIFPHLCSCRMCQKWSGALTVAWVEFSLATFEWDGPGGKPFFYRSSKTVQRGFCSACGSALCAIDDGGDTIAMTIATLREPALVKPGAQHSFKEEMPSWWKVSVE